MSANWQNCHVPVPRSHDNRRRVQTLQARDQNPGSSLLNRRRFATIQDFNPGTAPYRYLNTAPSRWDSPSYSLQPSDRCSIHDSYRDGYTEEGLMQPTYCPAPQPATHISLPWEDQAPSHAHIKPSRSSYSTGQILATNPDSQGLNDTDMREAAGRAAEKRRLEDRTRGKPKLRAREAARAAKVATTNARLPGGGWSGPLLPAAPAKARILKSTPPLCEPARSVRDARLPGRVVDGLAGGRVYSALPSPYPFGEPSIFRHPSQPDRPQNKSEGHIAARVPPAPIAQYNQADSDWPFALQRPRQRDLPYNTPGLERGSQEPGEYFASCAPCEPRHEQINDKSNDKKDERMKEEVYEDHDVRDDMQARKGPLSWFTSWL